MQYRKDKAGQDLSILGYGCMRFTKNGNKIDLEKAEREIMAAIDAGVNYFDTAYIYGGSEVALGEILVRNHCREQVHIATKLPHFMIKSIAGVERLFQEQLDRLQTDYVDYYLMHLLSDVGTWQKMLDLGMGEWLAEKKAQGKIRQIGFSYHGHTEMFQQLVDAWDWDFCQIQYNYMDEHTQAGRKGLEYAAKKGLPVIIMEPLRGGRLVNLLPEEAKAQMAQHPSGWSPAEWALRWLWDQPQVTVILSGMNSLEMLEENCRIASQVQAGGFTEEEFKFLEQVKGYINQKVKVDCTGCGYCMPCPKGVDIPGTFRYYNEVYTESRHVGRQEYLKNTALRQRTSGAGACVQCGRCEQHCPQGIPIRQTLKEARKELETPVYKGARLLVRLFKVWK